MDFQAKAAIAFLAILAILLYIKRDKLHKQNLVSSAVYILMYRTKVGLGFMDRTAKKYPRLLDYLGKFGIFLSFLGMLLISALMVKGTYDLLFVEGSKPAVGIVQPFSQGIPGTFFVPFFYLIISIFVLVIVHEFSHGIMARLYGLEIKSSGLAFFGILIPLIPAAFVEPDEKKMAKKPRKEQMSILGAGPFANIAFAFIIFGIVALAASPVADAILDYDGVLVTDIVKGDENKYPAESAGMDKGEVISAVDGMEVLTAENLTSYISSKKPGNTILITTNVSTYNLTLSENPENSSLPYMGVYLAQKTKIKPEFSAKFGGVSASAIFWLLGLFVWLYALNLGIGLFNLLPIPITDGGRMLHLLLEKFLSKEKAFKVWKTVAMAFILIVIFNLGYGFLK